MINRIFLTGSILVVVATVTSGVLTIGGPFQARKDRYDNLRFNDLVAIASSLTCDQYSKNALPDLPDKLSRRVFKAYCRSPYIRDETLVDDETGVAYNYTRMNAREFKVCAVFHDAVKTNKESRRVFSARIRFHTGSGCIYGKLRI